MCCCAMRYLTDFLEKKAVDLHAMWFDIFAGEMYLFSKPRRKFIIVDESTVDQLEKEVNQPIDFLEKKAVDLHAMWFDIFAGEMYLFSKPRRKFIIVDETTVDQLEKEVNQPNV
ncbi:unnamed protein product [Strongylus vulgaris]|uniref:Uncharacterized protein n=1 Tax=Strongylus vulgaris TaxID=40348 RepID=A0A3P7JWS7_STRVU|nr:unnamed protein product [Strongylus vulgaris]